MGGRRARDLDPGERHVLERHVRGCLEPEIDVHVRGLVHVERGAEPHAVAELAVLHDAREGRFGERYLDARHAGRAACGARQAAQLEAVERHGAACGKARGPVGRDDLDAAVCLGYAHRRQPVPDLRRHACSFRSRR